MSDTANCCHKQLVGQREFCPDCGLSRTEALVEACAPFLKDGETPAECIRRNRKDVDGCLTMLIDEKRKNDALRAERDEAVALLRIAKDKVAYMASGMTHAQWVTLDAQTTLARIEAFLAKLGAKP